MQIAASTKGRLVSPAGRCTSPGSSCVRRPQRLQRLLALETPASGLNTPADSGNYYYRLMSCTAECCSVNECFKKLLTRFLRPSLHYPRPRRKTESVRGVLTVRPEQRRLVER